jgi:hypothetical protein
MAVTSVYSVLFSLPIARRALEIIAQQQIIQVRDLKEKMESEANADDTRMALRTLKDLRLIDEKQTSIEDFNTLYVTAEGLETVRKINP